MEIRNAQFVAEARQLHQLPPPAFAEVAFAGRSNVGKSSLIRSLLQRKRLVRVGQTPGSTRGINLYRVDLKEPPATLDLVDLPGYGFARRSKQERHAWGDLVDGFLRDRPGLRAVVVIVDVRRGPEPDDLALLELLRELNLAPLLVATKLDKLSLAKRKPTLAQISKVVGLRPLGYGAPDLGRNDLWRVLLRQADIGPNLSHPPR